MFTLMVNSSVMCTCANGPSPSKLGMTYAKTKEKYTLSMSTVSSSTNLSPKLRTHGLCLQCYWVKVWTSNRVWTTYEKTRERHNWKARKICICPMPTLHSSTNVSLKRSVYGLYLGYIEVRMWASNQSTWPTWRVHEVRIPWPNEASLALLCCATLYSDEGFALLPLPARQRKAINWWPLGGWKVSVVTTIFVLSNGTDFWLWEEI